MEKLDAINLILRTAGLRPVNALNTGGTSDAAEAERVLDVEELRIQAEGWHYNIRFDVDLEPDADGYLNIPETVITIDSYGADSDIDVAMTGGRLYNVGDNEDTFEDTIKVWYVERYDFDCIPPHVRFYIARSAAYKFALERGVGGNRLQQAYDDMILAHSAAQRFNNRHTNVNMLRTTHHERVRGERTSPVI